jgi:hypothetical protein
MVRDWRANERAGFLSERPDKTTVRSGTLSGEIASRLGAEGIYDRKGRQETR